MIATKTQHTPGPWQVGIEDEGYFIANGELLPDIAKCIKSKADAALIAAAPELLEALKALFADYKTLADSGDAGFWSLENRSVGKQVLALIAKATGVKGDTA